MLLCSWCMWPSPSLKERFLCFCSASDNIPKADEIRTLVKDIWDTRIAKLRLSADSFISQQEAHAKVKTHHKEAHACSVLCCHLGIEFCTCIV